MFKSVDLNSVNELFVILSSKISINLLIALDAVVV